MKKYIPDNICDFCPIEKNNRHTKQYSSGCEGSRCDDAYDNYIEETDPVEVKMFILDEITKEEKQC
jgi:hypothetical protein